MNAYRSAEARQLKPEADRLYTVNKSRSPKPDKLQRNASAGESVSKLRMRSGKHNCKDARTRARSPSVVSEATAEERLVASSESAAVAFESRLRGDHS